MTCPHPHRKLASRSGPILCNKITQKVVFVEKEATIGCSGAVCRLQRQLRPETQSINATQR